MVFCSGRSGVVWVMVPAWPGEGDLFEPGGFAADIAPALIAGALGDAGAQEREPADQDVGADAVLEPVEDGPEQQLGFQVAEAVLDDFGLADGYVPIAGRCWPASAAVASDGHNRRFGLP